MQISACSNKEQGFTLIEIMIAVTLLSFGLLATGQLLYVAVGSSSLARSKSTAGIAAQNMLEFLGDAYRQNPSAADLTPGAHGPVQTMVANPTDESILNRFNVSWTVNSVPDPRPGKVIKAREVRITVAPVRDSGADNNRVGLNKTLNVTTIFSPKL